MGAGSCASSLRTGSAIEQVFHGTDYANLESIMKHGMDPGRRKHWADFFSTEPESSFSYCRGQPYGRSFGPRGYSLKMLVFLVLTLPPGFLDKTSGVVRMSHVEYELPILEVTFWVRT